MGQRHPRAALVGTALALGALPAAAGGTGAATALPPRAEATEWLALDREIAALAQAAAQAQPAPAVTVEAVLRTNYAWFDESPAGGIEDYSGFALDNVRPRIDGTVEDFSFQIELEAQSGTALVLDAYATWSTSESFSLTLGRFQPALLRSALVDPENLLFILRSLPGQYWQSRDEGVQAAAQIGFLLLRGSLENGADGAGDDYAYTVRADLDILGGGVRLVEGAYGSGREPCLSLGAGYRDDQQAQDDGYVIAADAALTVGRLAVSGEMLHYGEDAAYFGNFSDSNPFAVIASFMIDPERYEIALRYEKLDAQDEVAAWTLGINRYVAGHDVKWVLNVADVTADNDDQDGAAVALGLTVHV